MFLLFISVVRGNPGATRLTGGSPPDTYPLLRTSFKLFYTDFTVISLSFYFAKL